MTPNDVIADVKRLAQDSGLLRSPDSYRDDVLLSFVNQTIKQTSILRPDLFAFTDTAFAVTANQPIQTLPSDSIRLIEVFYVSSAGGGAIEEVDRDLLNRTDRDWVNATAGIPIKYTRHSRNPNKFFLYPRPQAGVTLALEYAQSPPTYTGGQTIALLPDAYLPALVNGTVYLVEAINNQSTSTSVRKDPNRAAAFQSVYAEMLGVSLQANAVLDNETTVPAGAQQ